MNGDGLSIANSHELEALKADILREVRLEINKAKQEIIDGTILTKHYLLLLLLFYLKNFMSLIEFVLLCHFHFRLFGAALRTELSRR